MLKVIEKSWSGFRAAYWRIENRHRLPEGKETIPLLFSLKASKPK